VLRESALAVAAAMRMPVKVPGPTPASRRSAEASSSPARFSAAWMAGSRVSEAPRAETEMSAKTSRPPSSALATATAVTEVEASRAIISIPLNVWRQLRGGSTGAWSGSGER
jgi:hypothetical protein